MKSRPFPTTLFDAGGLLQVSIPARWMMVALRALADDRGILIDDVHRITGTAFPTDTIPTPAVISELISANFVMRFTSREGIACMALRDFMPSSAPGRVLLKHSLPGALTDAAEVLKFVGWFEWRKSSPKTQVRAASRTQGFPELDELWYQNGVEPALM